MTDNYIHFSDIHIARSASYRLDDLMETLAEKFMQIKAYIDQHNIKAGFVSGDLFEAKYGSKIPHDVVSETVKMFKSLDIPIYGIPGNHDTYLKSIKKHPIQTLFETNTIIRVGERPESVGPGVYVVGFDHKYEKDIEQFSAAAGYLRPEGNPTLIGLTHLVMGEKPGMFYSEPQYGIEEFKSSPVDLFLNGHIHTPLGPLVNSKGQIFCQPGALRRTNTASEEMDRVPQVTLIKIDPSTQKIETEYLPIKVRSDIFVDWKREVKKESDKSINKFIDSVQNIKTAETADIGLLIKEAKLDPEVERIVMEAMYEKST